MPDPSKYDSEEKWMSACVPAKKSEGKTQEQAVGACLGIWREKKEMDEKAVCPEESIYRPLGGATSFAEWDETQTAREAAFQAQDLTWQFQDLLGNIMSSDIDDKSAAVSSLTDEFLARLEKLPKTKSLWDHIKEAFNKEKPMKTVDGKKYPSSDFLVVEDSQSPSTWHLQVKKNGTPDHGLMGAAKAALTSPGGHRGNRYQGPNKQQATAKLKRLYKQENMEWTKEIASPFIVWKEADQWRWLAVFSNKWRDEDNPPEILAEAAHKGFVEAVDSGDWPMPQAWLWHVRGTKFGVADYVAYDDSGFTIASGSVDKGKENVAEALSKDDNLATSHGMPVREIQRDKDDNTIITRYRSIEISALPSEAAANKWTGFEILPETKEVNMALPENKAAFLKDKIGEEALDALQESLAGKAADLEKEGIEFKEGEAQEEETTEEEQALEQEQDKEADAEEEAPQYVTVEDVAQAVGATLKPIMDQLSQLTEAFGELGKELKEQKTQLEELQKDDEAKIQKALSQTPAASLYARIGSVIGAEEAQIDGRSTLAKSGPKQNTEESNGPFAVGLINDLMRQSWGDQHGG